jgi:hypothetical protein
MIQGVNLGYLIRQQVPALPVPAAFQANPPLPAGFL